LAVLLVVRGTVVADVLGLDRTVVGVDRRTVVVDLGTVVVVVVVVVGGAVVVVVPNPSGNSKLDCGGGLNVAPLSEFTSGNCPAHCGSDVRAAAMYECHNSAGMVPPCTCPIGIDPEA
jgi:hypothetical protein